MSIKPRILHLSADHPDQFQPGKTRAIAGLVGGTADEFDHLVISLNRGSGFKGLLEPGRLLEHHIADQVIAVRYAAAPAIVGIQRAMRRLADWIVAELRRLDFRPDLIHGHKLTVEGFLARQLATRLGVPYALTLQGNTDQKLLSQRPDRTGAVRKIWQEARQVMAFAPWTADWCSERLGARAEPVSIIPCILPHDAMIAPSPSEHLVRTAFHLDFWRNKNITTLLYAIARLVPQFPEIRLEIAGDGSKAAFDTIAEQIARMQLQHRVDLIGPVSPEKIQDWFNGAAVFALATRRESFGMVFAEALLAGTPVIYPQGAAIEGFFHERSFARSVKAGEPASIANALAVMLKLQDSIKAELAVAQQDGALDRFRRDNVLGAYARFLHRACNTQPNAMATSA